MVENSSDLDVIIIGGGPGGMSAALWCAELGLKAIVFEKNRELGGQLLWTFNAIKNHLGFEAASGRELRDKFLQQIDKIDVQRLAEATIVSADLVRRSVVLADGRAWSAGAIIIASGVRRRRLEVPGEDEFEGRGILRSGVESRNEMRGKSVVVVGGGDAAVENAIILSETARKVTVVHRRNDFSARSEFAERAKKTRNIDVVFDTIVTAIAGNDSLTGVELQNIRSGEGAKITAEAVLIRIGVVPNTEMFRGQIDLDDGGYIRVDAACATTQRAVFAVGDAANPSAPTISGAVGQGATAAKSIAWARWC